MNFSFCLKVSRLWNISCILYNLFCVPQNSEISFHLYHVVLQNTRFQVLHTSGQIEILCDSLRDITPNTNDQQLGFSIKELIRKHQKIILFSDKIERIFSYIALIQFLTSTLLICCIGFMLVTVSNPSLKVKRMWRNDMRFTAVSIYIVIRCCSGSARCTIRIRSIARR